MIRIHPVSDMHVDMKHNEWDNPAVDAGVIVCAGDGMAPATLAIADVRRRWPDQQIIYVPGNHDFYSDHRSPDTRTTWEWQRENAPKVAKLHDVIWLDNASVTIDDTIFHGCTLWTDFMARPRGLDFNDAVRAALKMNDYRLIKVGRGRSGDTFKPRDSINDHKASVKWLTAQLATPFAGETVVVTHHAPSVKSLQAGVPIHDLDWCYASAALEHLMVGDNAPALWLHGHVHHNHDYRIGDTRVVCNPRGYPDGHPYTWRPGGPRENPDFDDQLVIEVGRDLMPTMRM
jgi:hypothetical protein